MTAVGSGPYLYYWRENQRCRPINVSSISKSDILHSTDNQCCVILLLELDVHHNTFMVSAEGCSYTRGGVWHVALQSNNFGSSNIKGSRYSCEAALIPGPGD